MSPPAKQAALWAMRWLLPALIVATGVGIVLVRGGDDISLEAGAMFVGAGLAVVLINVLWRMGVSGESAREREDEARRYFDEHGHWPDDKPQNEGSSADAEAADPARSPGVRHRVDEPPHDRGMGGGRELRRPRPRRPG